MFPVESLPWRVFACSHFACPLSTRVQEFACLACWFSGLVGWFVCLFVCVCLFCFVLLCFVWFCFVLFAYVLFCLCLLVSMYLYVYICRYE